MSCASLIHAKRDEVQGFLPPYDSLLTQPVPDRGPVVVEEQCEAVIFLLTYHVRESLSRHPGHTLSPTIHIKIFTLLRSDKVKGAIADILDIETLEVALNSLAACLSTLSKSMLDKVKTFLTLLADCIALPLLYSVSSSLTLSGTTNLAVKAALTDLPLLSHISTILYPHNLVDLPPSIQVESRSHRVTLRDSLALGLLSTYEAGDLIAALRKWGTVCGAVIDAAASFAVTVSAAPAVPSISKAVYDFKTRNLPEHNSIKEHRSTDSHPPVTSSSFARRIIPPTSSALEPTKTEALSSSPLTRGPLPDAFIRSGGYLPAGEADASIPGDGHGSQAGSWRRSSKPSIGPAARLFEGARGPSNAVNRGKPVNLAFGGPPTGTPIRNPPADAFERTVLPGRSNASGPSFLSPVPSPATNTKTEVPDFRSRTVGAPSPFGAANPLEHGMTPGRFSSRSDVHTFSQTGTASRTDVNDTVLALPSNHYRPVKLSGRMLGQSSSDPAFRPFQVKSRTNALSSQVAASTSLQISTPIETVSFNPMLRGARLNAISFASTSRSSRPSMTSDTPPDVVLPARNVPPISNNRSFGHARPGELEWEQAGNDFEQLTGTTSEVFTRTYENDPPNSHFQISSGTTNPTYIHLADTPKIPRDPTSRPVMDHYRLKHSNWPRIPTPGPSALSTTEMPTSNLEEDENSMIADANPRSFNKAEVDFIENVVQESVQKHLQALTLSPSTPTSGSKRPIDDVGLTPPSTPASNRRRTKDGIS